MKEIEISSPVTDEVIELFNPLAETAQKLGQIEIDIVKPTPKDKSHSCIISESAAEIVKEVNARLGTETE